MKSKNINITYDVMKTHNHKRKFKINII